VELEKITEDETGLAHHRNRIQVKLIVGQSLYKRVLLLWTQSVTPDRCCVSVGISDSQLFLFALGFLCSPLA